MKAKTVLLDRSPSASVAAPRREVHWPQSSEIFSIFAFIAFLGIAPAAC
jgi:hypothetical protein